MTTHFTRQIPIAVAVSLALAALAIGFLAALGVRSVVVGTASAQPAVPNPGHSYDQIGLPGGTWPALDADMLDGQHASDLATATDLQCSGCVDSTDLASGVGGLSNLVAVESNAQVSRSGAFPWEDLPITASITTTGGDVLVVFNAGMWKESDSPHLFFRARLDGQYSNASYWQGHANYRLPPINLTFLFKDVGAGTHTVAIQWSSLQGNLTTAGWYPDDNYYRLFAAEVN